MQKVWRQAVFYDTGLPSDPYLVAIAEYYQTSAIEENMSGKKGSDVNNGSALMITEGASITSIGLLRGIEIDWESRFEQENIE